MRSGLQPLINVWHNPPNPNPTYYVRKTRKKESQVQVTTSGIQAHPQTSGFEGHGIQTEGYGLQPVR
jgi:hypothetical protein